MRLAATPMPARCLVTVVCAAAAVVAVAAGQAGPRQRPPMPPITAPVMFDTPEADRILAALQVFPPDNPWNQDVSSLPVHRDSAKIVASIGADKHLDFNLDMGFILVPPNQKRVPVKILDYPAESDPGPFPGARQRADRELAARPERGREGSAEAGRDARAPAEGGLWRPAPDRRGPGRTASCTSSGRRA